MFIRWLTVASALFLIQSSCFGEEQITEVTDTPHEIAITIDDLPFVGSGTNTPANFKRTQDRFMALVNALVDNQVPATGFIIGGSVAKNEWDFLETFKKQGLTLGNHTYTHKSLNGLTAEKYIADLEKADNSLAQIMTEPKYFRYPYLAEGKGEKKQKVLDWLTEHQYTVAPVTIDTKDYEFNAQFYRIPYSKRPQSISSFKKRYLAFIWKQTLKADKKAKVVEGQPIKHILLIHANLLNSLCLADIIEMYKSHGYKFVTLADALKGNTAPVINDSSSTAPVSGTPEKTQIKDTE